MSEMKQWLMFIWKWWWNILISTTQHKRMSFKITDFSPSFSSFTEFLHPLFLHAIPSGQTFVVLTWHYQMFVITCRDWTSRVFNRLFRFPRRDDESRYLEWRCLEWRKGFPWLPSSLHFRSRVLSVFSFISEFVEEEKVVLFLDDQKLSWLSISTWFVLLS